MASRNFRCAALIPALMLLAATLASGRVAADDTPAPRPGIGIATFGSGCFWCTESDFDKVPGVLTTVSGYMGGKTARPTYEEVSKGTTGHVEVLQITYDTSKVNYETLLAYYWRTTDVVDGKGQFCDRGNQYRPVIFTHGDEQMALATAGKAALEGTASLGKQVAVEIAPARAFAKAEDYHQDFHRTNPLRYYAYRKGCRRDQRLDALWGKDRLKGILESARR